MKYAFIHANVFDGVNYEEIRKNLTVLVDGDKIEKVGYEGEIPRGYTVYDLNGKYLCPGLINLHAHLFGTGKPSKMLGGGAMQKAVVNMTKTKIGHRVADMLAENSVTQAVNSGVTTLRSSGDFCYSDVRARDNINRNKYIGPRLIVPGVAITCIGGHGDGTFSQTSDSIDELVSFVEERKSNNVDYIKICVTGGVMDAKVKGEPGVTKMTVEQTKAVCDRAHELGYMVASHTESSKGIEVALQGGVDTVEHGSFLDDNLVSLFKEKKSAFIVTTSPALPLARLSPEITKLNELCIYNSEVVMNGMIEGAKRSLSEGIPVGLGTDASCPLVTPYNMWREIDFFSRYYGVSNGFALHTATLVNAQIIGIDNITGSVKDGKSADLIVVKDNPLESISALRDIDMVMVRGSLIREPKVKKDEQIEQWLDSLQ